MALNITAFTGSEAVGATEHSMTTDTAGPDTDTTEGCFQAVIDVSDMVAGDQLQIRVYEKARAADGQYIVDEWVLTGVQSAKQFVTPALILGAGWDYTLKALSGTITVNWSIRRVS